MDTYLYLLGGWSRIWAQLLRQYVSLALMDIACPSVSKWDSKGPENYRELGENIQWSCGEILGLAWIPVHITLIISISAPEWGSEVWGTF